MTLYLVGLGIDGSPTLRGLSILKNAEEIYLERYTLPIPSLDQLPKEIREKVVELGREEVESDFLIKKAKEKDIALIVIGDPLSATTHFSLILESKKRNIDVEVVHNSSIFSAIAETGLSLYKFGYTITVAYWRPNYKPTSPLEWIEKNLSLGLHTLALLDISDRGPMNHREGIETLQKMEEVRGKKVLPKNLIVVKNLGREGQTILYGEVEKLKNLNLGEGVFSLVIPGKLNAFEEEAVNLYRI